MKKGTHPEYRTVSTKCTCEHQFDIRSTLKEDELRVDVCNACHPFYTGNQKVIDREARVKNFNDRFGGFSLLSDSDSAGAA